jgi:hypothetical protein
MTKDCGVTALRTRASILVVGLSYLAFMMAVAAEMPHFRNYFDEQNEPGLYLVKPAEPALEYTCE